MEATEYAFPFDAEETEDGYDREYIADDFARYFRAFITSGIIADGGNIADSLQVVANSDMTTTLKKGNLIIDGYRYELAKDMTFLHRAADGVLDRIDRITITLDTAKREISAILQEGEYSYKPVAAQCRRNSEYMDYVVADVRIVAGTVKVTQANITDTRLNTELCGIAWPFWTLDTEPFFAQLQSFYEEFVIKSDASYAEFQAWAVAKKEAISTWQAKEQAETDAWQKKQADDLKEWADNFILQYEGWMSGKVGDWTNEILDWFQNLREQLTDNAEVHLQEQIGNLQELKTAKKDSLVNAVNEVKDSAGVTGVKGKAESAYRKGNVNITPEDIGAVNKAGDTMTGSLSSSKTSGTHLAGNQGQAIINSTAEAGAYTMLDKLNSKNGCFTDGVYEGKRQFHYTARSTVAAGKNEVTKSLTILDENGDSDFPGKVNALSFGGNGNSLRVQFNPSADRHLPANNDILYNQLSYIYANLRDLEAVAFSSDYGEIRNKPIGSKIHLAYYEATYGPEDFGMYFIVKWLIISKKP